MVAIVLVSHSRTLAEGLAELLAQIGSEDVPVRVAAGSPDGGLGTSVDEVRRVLQELDPGDGAVIIPDLGSAVLSVKAALNGADQARTILVDAPFVEGAVAATVTAATGASIEDVAAAAREARDVPKV
jgi:PTS hybrid protein